MNQQTVTNKDGAKHIGLAPLHDNPVPLQVRARLKHRLLRADSVEALLQCFYESLCELLHLDGLVYEHPGKGLHWSAGLPGTHRASYHLNTADGDQGHLLFSRCHDRFSENELEQLEVLMGTLIYPLKIVSLLERSGANEAAGSRESLEAGSNDRLHRQLSERCASAEARSSALLLLDIDTVDELQKNLPQEELTKLMLAARRQINHCLQPQDQVFSLGSRQIAVLLGHTCRDRTNLTAEWLLMHLGGSSVNIGEHESRIRLSVGAATLEADDTPHKVLDRAEIGLKMARHSGGDQVRYIDAGVIESARARTPYRLPTRAAS